MPKRLGLVLLAVLWAGLAGLAAPEPSPRFSVARFGAREGLPQKSVLTMTQTRDGYLWVGTLAGLARFDGRTFTSFDPNNTPGLPSERIAKLFEDHAGDLWIGTENAGVVRLDPAGVVHPVPYPPGGSPPRLVAACEDGSGAVWLHTAGSGSEGLTGRLARWRDGRLDTWPCFESVGRFLVPEKGGPIWVGLDSALFPLTTDTPPDQSPMREVLPVASVDFLLASAAGGYWRLAGGPNGRVVKCRQAAIERDLGPYPWDQSRTRVSAACEDREGNLIVGTLGDGVYWFSPSGKATHISRAEGLLYPSVLSLCVDREDCLWVGTYQDGLNRVRRQSFTSPPEAEGVSVQSLCTAPDGAVWAGYYGERVDRFADGGVETMTNLFQFVTDAEIAAREEGAEVRVAYLRAVRSVLVDQGGRVWVGTYNHGLLRRMDGRFVPAPGAELLSPHILALHEDHQGGIWVGTEGGLGRWDGREWRTFSSLHGLRGSSVQAIAADAHGDVWVGTEAGAHRFHDGKFTHFGREEGLPGDRVASLLVDAEGVVWAGTSGGLARYDGRRWTAFTPREGLPTSNVGYLAEDGLGFLWMGSNGGLIRVAKRALNAFAAGPAGEGADPLSFRTYDESEGLPTSECSSGSQPAACRTPDGRLWFATIRGLAVVDPSRLRANTNQLPVVIESVALAGMLMTTNGPRPAPLREVVLPPGKQGLEIRFASLNLAAADRARFKYRLDPEGHAPEWSPPSESRAAYFGKLTPGRYTFQVTACNEDGVWNRTGCSLEVTVLPPFWRKPWFLGLLSACLLAAVAGSVHYVSTQKLQRELGVMRQHEALEAERARIARDLHDQLGANLTQVTLLGEMAEADKDLPAEVEAHARQIAQTARETTHALDEIVWTVNPANDTLDGLVNYLCKYAQEYAALAGLRYRLEVPETLPATPITPELRHNAFLVAKEAVNNVVKHAQAHSIWLRLRLEPDRFTLEIQDDGRGLPPEAENKGRNGLRNMRRRMQDVGGTFEITPATPAGSVARLSAPLGRGGPGRPASTV